VRVFNPDRKDTHWGKRKLKRILACFNQWPSLIFVVAYLPKLRSAAVRQRGLVCIMATHPINDYYVVAYQQRERPDRWSWEIRRKSIPLGIKMIGDGYQSDTAARIAGRQALADFLIELLKEEKRK
jgi:hypothetical protein